MKLIFENANGEERIISYPKDEEGAFEYIHAFCEERNFKIFYIRKWTKGNRTTFDVGSHTEFFHLENDEV